METLSSYVEESLSSQFTPRMTGTVSDTGVVLYPPNYLFSLPSDGEALSADSGEGVCQNVRSNDPTFPLFSEGEDVSGLVDLGVLLRWTLDVPPV